MTDKIESEAEPTLDKELPQPPGELLQQAREEAGMSLREAADKLHLLPRQVTALEAGDYQQFNGEVFCKGYLRAYGKLLGIDAGMLVERYLQLLPEKQPAAMVPKSVARQIQQPGKGRSIQYWSLAAFIAVVAVLWMRNNDGMPEPMTSGVLAAQQIVVDDNDRSLVQTLEPAITNPAAGMPSLAAVDTVGLVEGEAVQVASLVVAADKRDDNAMGTVQGASSADNPPANAPSLGMSSIEEGSSFELAARDLLQFRFTDDCWVKVTDSDDNVIFANLKRARDTLELSGSAPFRVLLGYAPGVSLDYNGKPVTIKVNKKNQSARLVVGQL